MSFLITQSCWGCWQNSLVTRISTRYGRKGKLKDEHQLCEEERYCQCNIPSAGREGDDSAVIDNFDAIFIGTIESPLLYDSEYAEQDNIPHTLYQL